MLTLFRFGTLGFVLTLLSARFAHAAVLIDEIMYHPSSENILEEYVELYNNGATNVSLNGWRFSKGVQFSFTNGTLPAGGFLVVAAHVTTFTNKYPGVTNVIGNWTGRLSNSRNDLDLDDAAGNRVDSVTYADEGDWAVRRRGPVDHNHQGWSWYAAHDGGGRSLELINPNLSNNYGQNWASSILTNGTPGRTNSVLQTNIAPLILDVQHLPPIPRSIDSVLVTARLLDERTTNLTATLRWRLAYTNLPFATQPMFDDGLHDDGVANDGVFASTIPAQTNNALVEFYVAATDFENQARTWPAPAIETNGVSLGQAANALYQVDDSTYNGTAPLYKAIMRDSDRAELAAIGSAFNGEQNSDAQMNGTFISLDATGTDIRYLASIRNRGHSSRNVKPNNYRINFPSDRGWKGVAALNLNGQYTHLQVLGAVLSLQSGAVGGDSRPVQVRVNNANLANNGPQTYGGMYAANEVVNGDWAEHWYPDDSSGNVYRAIRDLPPPNFDYRGTNVNSYTNTYFKESNVSENDWTDLVAMLEVMGENRTNLFTTLRARGVINVEQWLLHLAVMNVMGNGESGLNTGNNDDYRMYRGVVDPRFVLTYFDLDQLFGVNGALATNSSIFRATMTPISGDTQGTWKAMNWFMHWPEFEQIYYRTLQRLLDTSFSASEFNSTVDQTLGGFVPANNVAAIKTWMNARRGYVQSIVTPYLATNPVAPVAAISGEPRSPTPLRSATLAVGGPGVTQYRYSLNGAAFGATNPVATLITLSNLPHGSTNSVSVIAVGAAGVWQNTSNATVSRTWIVNTNWPALRINEVLARNVAAFNHAGTFPDVIELYNEGNATADLSGLRLTDNASSPNKFTFPMGTTLGTNNYLVVLANNADGTPGLHAGFSLNQDGEGVFLFDKVSAGGALLDSVQFGLQLADLSVGRTGNAGDFVLTQPSPGADNVVQPLGDPNRLSINEWLASEFAVSSTDFVELYNPETLPVALGGLYFTDNPIGEPAKHKIAPLTFISAGTFREFKADGDPQQGFDHLDFKLAAEQGLIALLRSDFGLIDLVVYGPQQTDVSQGRSPDGSNSVVSFAQPTPGAPNQTLGSSSTNAVLNEIFANNQSFTNAIGRTPDWVEIYNPSTNAVNFADMSLTDDPATPRKWVFAPGSSIAANGRLVIECDDGQPVSPTNTGFGLSAAGDAVYLFKRPADGGSVLDSINFGVQAKDFSIGRIADGSGSWKLTLPTRSTANVIAGLGNASVLKVNEWMAAPANGDDWLELFNPNLQPVELSGLALTDDPNDRDKSPFVPLSFIGPEGFLMVIADGNPGNGADHAAFQLDGAGDFIGLYWPIGTQIDALSFGPQSAGVSSGRFLDGAANLISFAGSASPGAPNYLLLTNLFINELLSHTDPPLEDAVEIRNPGTNPVNIGGWYLSNTGADPRKYLVPSNTVVAAGGYQVFYEYQFGTNTSPDALVPFSFNSAHGDEVHLSQAMDGNLTGYRARAAFGAAVNGVAFGRFLTSGGEEFVAMSGRSFGVDNPATLAQFRGGSGLPNPYPLVGPVVISEIQFHPTNHYAGNTNAAEFLELLNLTAAPVPLYDPAAVTNRWRLDGGVEFTFPPGATLPANGRLLLVSFDPTVDPAASNWFRAAYQVPANVPILGPFSGALANEGEDLQLLKPDPPQTAPNPDAGFVPYVLVEHVGFRPAPPWATNGIGFGASLQRNNPAGFGNEPVNWFAAAPSAGRNNTEDSDGDGLPDYWEIQNGLDPQDPGGAQGANGDPDGDHLTNAQEFLANTRPLDAADYLRIESVNIGSGTATLALRAAAGRSYSVLFRNGSLAGPWFKLADVPASANGSLVQVVDVAPAGGNRFYILVTPSSANP